ncbi:MAG: hypothetical protein M3M96_00285, partial [Candidatus Eremiobacteraeota bacterium]|nr:hypothetical protein [Candidatus Eremiobacteraeota bacterium]
MQYRPLITLSLLAVCAATVAAAGSTVTLPSGWRIDAPQGAVTETGTMPQGLALSPDGTRVAVVESGVNPPALHIFASNDLHSLSTIALKGAFGKPVWLDAENVLVAGGNTDALLEVNVSTGGVTQAPLAQRAWPAAVAVSSQGMVATSNDDGSVTLGTGPALRNPITIPLAPHPGDLLFSTDGKELYVAMRGASNVDVVDTATHSIAHMATGLHPSALALSADGARLYVAAADDDAVGIFDTRSRMRIANVGVGFRAARVRGSGASPNALALDARGALFVSCGALNSIAVIPAGGVTVSAARIPAGWYPTGVAIGSDGTLFVSDGKGEGSRPNPEFDPRKRNSPGYIAATNYGSLRRIDVRSEFRNRGNDPIANVWPRWTAPLNRATVLRAHGPISHVIYIIKENRSYDQVLGDMPGANGRPSLVWFGRAITPNQHAIAARFGLLDNAFANAQVSADGHNWTDAAFANDYVERYWPPNYGGRRSWDFASGKAPLNPHNGFLWDAALRAHVTFRDYGEETITPKAVGQEVTTDFRGLSGHLDSKYRGWDLAYSDTLRYAEWRREFDSYVVTRTLPSLEIMALPNDHTAGTAPGLPTPEAYVAINDWAVGKIVDAVSHS